jgi:xanthine dehydrogenase accessory factor
VLVQVADTQGSVPREAGTWMAVFADALVGTIGGGHLEYDAIARARALLEIAGAPQVTEPPLRVALGPSLGQCCGGVVQLRFERVGAGDAAELAQRLGQAPTHTGGAVRRRPRRPSRWRRCSRPCRLR